MLFIGFFPLVFDSYEMSFGMGFVVFYLLLIFVRVARLGEWSYTLCPSFPESGT